MLQLSLKANGGKTFGRAPKGLTENSTEAEVDAYLSNPKYYPLGMFDDTPDGNGDTMHIPPFFRQDLAAPFGSGGEIAKLDDFNNLVYTALLDQTNLTSPGGRAFLHKLGGAAGDEIADNYVKVLDAHGRERLPVRQGGSASRARQRRRSVGVSRGQPEAARPECLPREHLPAPAGAQVDARAAAHGRQLFTTVGCTSCHNADQIKSVPDRHHSDEADLSRRRSEGARATDAAAQSDHRHAGLYVRRQDGRRQCEHSRGKAGDRVAAAARPRAQAGLPAR